MSAQVNEFYRKPWCADEYFAPVTINYDKIAYVKKTRAPRILCHIHKDRLGNSKGQCGWCLSRLRKLIKIGIVNKNTPVRVVEEILKLPSYKHTGRSGTFIKQAKTIIADSLSEL